MGKGTDINYPEQPSYGESMRDAMQAQIDLGEDLYEAEAQYRPRYAQLETDILGRTLLGPRGGQEFQQRGLLDIMGAPAQQYATGDVAPMRPDRNDPMAQFEQGYGGQQAPLQRMRGGYGGGQQRGGMRQRGMNGMSGKFGQPVGGGRTMQGTGRVLGAGQDQRIRRGSDSGFMDAEQGANPMSDYNRLTRAVALGPQAAREAEARLNAYREPVAEIGDTGMMGQTRDTGMTGELDPFTGRPEFGGMAQYGADIAEYGAGRQRAADIRDVGKYGAQATRALREADPLSNMMLGRMAGIAGQEMGGAAQGRYRGLLGEMGGQAREDLAAGDDLTARGRRQAIQESRRASEARGRQFDPLAAVNELEALESARTARRLERRGFAGQMMQSEAARRGEARGYGQQVLGASRAMAADPFMAILGRPSGAGQQIAQQGMGQAQYGLSAGPGVVFNPEAG